MFSESMDAHKDKSLMKKYSSTLMSNHKWRKLFMVMAEHGRDFSGIEYHFTDTQNVLYGHTPCEQQIWETAIDDPVEGVGGPVEYKHIEYIFIPRVYSFRPYDRGPLKERELNLGHFLRELSKVGSFPVEEIDTGILVHGYKT